VGIVILVLVKLPLLFSKKDMEKSFRLKKKNLQIGGNNERQKKKNT
jgi:hypothetical protein